MFDLGKENIMTDESVRQNVVDELSWEPSVDGAHIGVTARDGVVTLTGHVTSYAEKVAAEHAAERVFGVKAVAQDLEVRYTYEAGHADDDVAKRVLQSLAWDIFIPKDRIKVKVEKGRVTLSGELDWQYQKEQAEGAVRRLSGVTGVTDAIRIKPVIKAVDISDKIKAAFGRNAQIEAGDIDIATDGGGKVTLTGHVESYHERTLAGSTAWSAPGVMNVDNCLTVG